MQPGAIGSTISCGLLLLKPISLCIERTWRNIKPIILSANSKEVQKDVIDGNYIALLEVEGTDYIVGMKVPKSDIRSASDDLRESAYGLIKLAYVGYVIIWICIVFCGGVLAW